MPGIVTRASLVMSREDIVWRSTLATDISQLATKVRHSQVSRNHSKFFIGIWVSSGVTKLECGRCRDERLLEEWLVALGNGKYIFVIDGTAKASSQIGDKRQS